MDEIEFQPFAKIARFSRDIVITEKIDGTNGCIYVGEDGVVRAGSRSRWIEPGPTDNFYFAQWVKDNEEELRTKLGPGRHFGEWWGSGIGRRYDMKEKVFSLFNTHLWNEETKPACCSVVPILHKGAFTSSEINLAITWLREHGSAAAPGFMKPEGIVIYHTAAAMYFKKTLEKDEEWKGMPQ